MKMSRIKDFAFAVFQPWYWLNPMFNSRWSEFVEKAIDMDEVRLSSASDERAYVGGIKVYVSNDGFGIPVRGPSPRPSHRVNRKLRKKLRQIEKQNNLDEINQMIVDAIRGRG